MSTFPCSSHLITTTFMPTICALAGFVPCAELGIRQTFLFVSPFCSWYFLITIKPANSPCAPALGCKDTPENPVTDLNQFFKSVKRVLYPSICSTGANGCGSENSLQVTGIISATAFNFIVHEPKAIMDLFNAISASSNFFKYLNMSVSE